jgi:hypothetical protein
VGLGRGREKRREGEGREGKGRESRRHAHMVYLHYTTSTDCSQAEGGGVAWRAAGSR